MALYTSSRPVKFLARGCWAWKLIWTPREAGDPLQVSKQTSLKKVKRWKSTKGNYHIHLLRSSPDICFWPHLTREYWASWAAGLNQGEHSACSYVVFWEARDHPGPLLFTSFFLFSWCSSPSCTGLVTDMNTPLRVPIMLSQKHRNYQSY